MRTKCIKLSTILLTSIILSACSGASTTPSETGGTPDVPTPSGGYGSIPLPNGSIISYATDDVSVTQGKSTSTSFSIHGGTPGYQATVSSLSLASGHIKVLAKSGDNIESALTLTPSPCTLVSGSESQVSCSVGINASNLAVGTYTIEAPVVYDGITSMLYESLEVTAAPAPSPTPTPTPTSVAGTITINPKADTLVFNQKQAYTVSLNGSQDVSGVAINVAAATPGLITLAPSSCTLSTGSNTCTVLVTAGSSVGQTYLTATAAGYTITPSAITVNGSALINGGNSLTNFCACSSRIRCPQLNLTSFELGIFR